MSLKSEHILFKQPLLSMIQAYLIILPVIPDQFAEDRQAAHMCRVLQFRYPEPEFAPENQLNDEAGNPAMCVTPSPVSNASQPLTECFEDSLAAARRHKSERKKVRKKTRETAVCVKRLM